MYTFQQAVYQLCQYWFPAQRMQVPGSAGAVISKIEIEQNIIFVFRYCLPVPGTEFAGIKNSLYSVPIRLMVNCAGSQICRCNACRYNES